MNKESLSKTTPGVSDESEVCVVFLLSAALLALVALLLVGCGTADAIPVSAPVSSTPTLSEVRSVSTPATKTYLGAVGGTEALIGIVLDGAQVRAYVCDGTPSRLARLSEWFDGQVKGGKVQASSPDQQAQLTAQFADQSASGTLTLASGRVYPFTIPRVPAAAQVGIFEGTALIAGQRYHAGWLRLAGGDQRGAATYYPAGPVRGSIVIALLPEYPAGSV
jgi:hypothetical protein